VSRVKKHPCMLAMLERWVERQTETIGTELATISREALEVWNAKVDRELVPRLGALSAWTKKAELEPSVRVALEGFTKRWKKRADDVVLDWAELLTDPVFLAEGFADSDVTSRDIDRLTAWVRRQLAKPQPAPVDEEGKPVLDSEGVP